MRKEDGMTGWMRVAMAIGWLGVIGAQRAMAAPEDCRARLESSRDERAKAAAELLCGTTGDVQALADACAAIRARTVAEVLDARTQRLVERVVAAREALEV